MKSGLRQFYLRKNEIFPILQAPVVHFNDFQQINSAISNSENLISFNMACAIYTAAVDTLKMST